jgi:predicted nucleic acid-binding protein
MEAAIPKAVENECCGGKKTLDSLIIRKALDESRIKAKIVRNRKLVAKLEEDFSMGRGESEAIALAIEERALLVGIDDKDGMNACRLSGVPFTTAIGILVRSRQKGLIGRSDALIKLSALARYGWYKDAILEDARLRMEEQP